jgi:transcriptional regulator with XRE-family HTH domain
MRRKRGLALDNRFFPTSGEILVVPIIKMGYFLGPFLREARMSNDSATITTVGELIAAARGQKGMTRTKLAEISRISPNSMAKYEKAGQDDGKYPPLPKLVRICEILEIDPRSIFDLLMGINENNVWEKFSFRGNFRSQGEWQELANSSLISTIEILSLEIASLRKELRALSPSRERERPFIGDPLLMQNGSEPDGPSRSDTSQIDTEAVGAASTSRGKGTD